MSPECKDEQILALLFCNSRASLRDIGREVDLGASAVRARINRLLESGSIIGFAARVNPAAFGFPGLVFISYEDAEISGETRRVLRLVGKPIAQGETITGTTCLLKAVTMADGTMLGKLRGMPDLTRVSEIATRWNSASRLSTTDLLIIKCLLSNPRAAVEEMAECASVSTKTVSHRLDGLLRERILTLRIDFDASKAKLVEGFVFVRMREGVPTTTLGMIDETLRKGTLCASHLRFDRDMIVTYCCAGTVFDLGPSLKRIRLLDGVQDVTAHLFYQLRFYHDWVFEEIEARTRPMAQPIPGKA